VHPTFAHKQILDALNATWMPEDDDAIGIAAARRAGNTIAIVDEIDAVLAGAAHSPENLAALRTLGVSACLVVPMWIGDDSGGVRSIDGAITFMSSRPRNGYADDEVAFAELVTRACGRALRNSRLIEALTQQRLAADLANQSKSDMLGHVTHELRTPLAAIGGYAELIQMGVRGPINAAQQRDLQRIRWNQQHLLSLITQILSFVRVDTGRTEFTLKDIDLGTLVHESADMLAPLIAEKHHAFRLEACDPGTMIGFGDGDKVRQIAINLITNALKYSPPGSEIVARCGMTRTTVFAEVQDSGPGIAPDQIETVFLPFVQLASGAADRAGGVGLGLAIARQLAQGMNGSLTVDTLEGRGSTFRLSLPLTQNPLRVDGATP
jgi:signal transduction histidine kinase